LDKEEEEAKHNAAKYPLRSLPGTASALGDVHPYQRQVHPNPE
jgi:hypothetical protein